MTLFSQTSDTCCLWSHRCNLGCDFQLVHGPSTKTRVAYILSLLHQPAENSNESTMMEDEESDIEDGDITMLNTEVMHSALTGQLDIPEVDLVVVQERFSVPAVLTLTNSFRLCCKPSMS